MSDMNDITYLGAQVKKVFLRACKITAANHGYSSVSDWLRDLAERGLDEGALARAESLFLNGDAHIVNRPAAQNEQSPAAAVVATPPPPPCPACGEAMQYTNIAKERLDTGDANSPARWIKGWICRNHAEPMVAFTNPYANEGASPTAEAVVVAEVAA